MLCFIAECYQWWRNPNFILVEKTSSLGYGEHSEESDARKCIINKFTFTICIHIIFSFSTNKTSPKANPIPTLKDCHEILFKLFLSLMNAQFRFWVKTHSWAAFSPWCYTQRVFQSCEHWQPILQKPRLVGASRDLWGSASPTPLLVQGPHSRLHRIVSRWIWDLSRAGEIYNLSGQLGPGLPHPQSSKVSPHVQNTTGTVSSRGQAKQKQAVHVHECTANIN